VWQINECKHSEQACVAEKCMQAHERDERGVALKFSSAASHRQNMGHGDKRHSRKQYPYEAHVNCKLDPTQPTSTWTSATIHTHRSTAQIGVRGAHLGWKSVSTLQSFILRSFPFDLNELNLVAHFSILSLCLISSFLVFQPSSLFFIHDSAHGL
jgi:hypothetical protein